MKFTDCEKLDYYDSRLSSCSSNDPKRDFYRKRRNELAEKIPLCDLIDHVEQKKRRYRK